MHKSISLLFFQSLGSSEEHYAKNLAVQSMRLGFRYFSISLV